MAFSPTKYKKIIFPNGLTLILYKIKEIQSAYILCKIASGNIYAKDESQIGIAHFLEHLSFCSTEKFKTNKDISSILYEIGAHANAMTSVSQTIYWIKSPSININKSIDILHQLIFKSNVSKENIEKERKIILNEYKDFMANESSLFIQKVSMNRFLDLPQFQKRATGDEKNIKSIDENHLNKWKNKYIKPNNIVVSITGNYEEKEIINNFLETFGKEPKGKGNILPKYNTDKYSAQNLYINKKDTDQIRFELTWPAFGWKEVTRHEEIVLQMLDFILGQGPLSRLNLSLRETKNISYYCKSYASLFPHLGYLGISCSVEKNELKNAFSEISSVIKQLIQHGPTNEELSIAKKYLRLDSVMRFETPESIASYLGAQMFDYGEIWEPERYENERNLVTNDEIKNMAKKIFNPKKANVNVHGNLTENEAAEFVKLLKY